MANRGLSVCPTNADLYPATHCYVYLHPGAHRYVYLHSSAHGHIYFHASAHTSADRHSPTAHRSPGH